MYAFYQLFNQSKRNPGLCSTILRTGTADKCYKQVWLKHVFPKYGFNYDTFLRYMRVDTSCLEELLVEQE